MKQYKELIRLSSFEERLSYLKLNGKVGNDTFGFDRYMNQAFYKSKEWKDIRDYVIVRDNGCDLGLLDYPIGNRILVHHMNPLMPDDIIHATDYLLNPEYLICVSFESHNYIHYGIQEFTKHKALSERRPNDTCPWRK